MQLVKIFSHSVARRFAKGQLPFSHINDSVSCRTDYSLLYLMPVLWNSVQKVFLCSLAQGYFLPIFFFPIRIGASTLLLISLINLEWTVVHTLKDLFALFYMQPSTLTIVEDDIFLTACISSFLESMCLKVSALRSRTSVWFQWSKLPLFIPVLCFFFKLLL